MAHIFERQKSDERKIEDRCTFIQKTHGNIIETKNAIEDI